MSVSSVSNNLAHFPPTSLNLPSKQFQQEFQQLGHDLQSGNLSGAQAIYSHLPKPGHGQSALQSGTPIEQDFSNLRQALKSGNLSAAQQDYTQIQHRIENRFDQSTQAAQPIEAQPIEAQPPSRTTISLTA